jgi:hypothetical protein
MTASDQSGTDQPSRDWLLAEFEFLREGMRQDQRERLAFVGFALAASSAVLGLLARDPTHSPSSNQAFVLIGIALSVTIVAEVLTIRATTSVASAGHYLREFVEPSTSKGLQFQTRHPQFLEQLQKGSPNRLLRFVMRASVSGSWGLAVAYGILTTGLLAAWFIVDLSGSRGFWRSGAVTVGACLSFGMTWLLWWTAKRGAQHVGNAWSLVNGQTSPSD